MCAALRIMTARGLVPVCAGVGWGIRTEESAAYRLLQAGLILVAARLGLLGFFAVGWNAGTKM